MNTSQCLLLVAGLASTLMAQGERREGSGKNGQPAFPTNWSRIDDKLADHDPYAMTEGRPVLVRGFAGGQDPKEVEQSVGSRLLWLETTHFRIGSNLPAIRLLRSDPHTAVITDELAALRKTLPKIALKVDVIDPWLRLHLYGQRLENLRSEIENLFGATQKEWPQGKQEVLLVHELRTLQKFATRYLGYRPQQTVRHHFPADGTLLTAVAVDAFGVNLHHDQALHAHLIYNAVGNLIDGYRGYRFDIPVWLKVGLGQVHARRVDPTRTTFEQQLPVPADMQLVENWHRRVRTIVDANEETKAATLMTWFDVRPMKFNDTVTCWSRMEFLLARHRAGFPEFIRGIKTPRDQYAKSPVAADILQCQAEALKNGFGFSFEEFDVSWRNHILSMSKSDPAYGSATAQANAGKARRTRR